MKLTMRKFQEEADFWRIRNFARDVYLANDRLPFCEHVTELDFWRWHYILTCGETEPADEVTQIWETEDGRIAAVLHPICHDEVRILIHPAHYSTDLLEEMIESAEEVHSDWYQETDRILYVTAFTDETQRQDILDRRGYVKRPRFERYWLRDLNQPVPEALIPNGYQFRSLGGEDEHSARSWASWRVFHPDEPDGNYDNDPSWYQNLQSAPLYRRDLDLVAAGEGGEIAAFCTIWYDDYTCSAQMVFVGTVPQHQGRDLAKGLMLEGMKRLQRLGCTQVFVIAGTDPNENALFESVMQRHFTTEPWTKIWTPCNRQRRK